MDEDRFEMSRELARVLREKKPIPEELLPEFRRLIDFRYRQNLKEVAEANKLPGNRLAAKLWKEAFPDSVEPPAEGPPAAVALWLVLYEQGEVDYLSPEAGASCGPGVTEDLVLESDRPVELSRMLQLDNADRWPSDMSLDRFLQELAEVILEAQDEGKLRAD